MRNLFRILLVSGALLFPQFLVVNANDEFGEWSDPQYEYANTARYETYLTPSEKEVIRLTNLARMNGPLFADTYVKKYYGSKGDKTIESLVLTLRRQRMLSPLIPNMALHRSALRHAADMGINGKTGYFGTNGQPFYDRIHQFYPSAITFAENNFYHASEPISVVLGMLVDRSDSLFANRKNLLSSDIDLVGVSIQPHKSLCNTTVMDFAKHTDQSLTGPTASATKNSRNSSFSDRCPQSSKVPIRGIKRKRFILFPF